MYHRELLEREAATPRPLGFACSAEMVTNLSEDTSNVINSNTKREKGTWFDEGYDLREPEGSALCSSIMSLIDECEVRDKVLRKGDRDNRRVLIRHIVANGLLCHHFYQPGIVAHFCKADGYRNKPRWLSGRAFARTIELLAKADLVKATLGAYQISSTYQVTDKLILLAEMCGATVASLKYLSAPDRSIRLRDHKKREVSYEPNPNIVHWRSALTDYNTFLTSQSISLPMCPAEERAWVTEFNRYATAKGRPTLRTPLLIGTDLHRVFNNSSFDEGGRLYGGWWISAPKRLRKNILLNGQPVIELDYSGCAVRMLYHLRDMECDGDPYWLEPIANLEKATGLPEGHFRDAIKCLVQVALNDRTGGRGAWIPLPDGVSFAPHFTRLDVMAMIRQKHAAIADAFNSGIGLQLQREDSDLALSIVTRLMQQGIVALPVHDSFVVPAVNENELRLAMTELYENRFGYRPVIG